jgi:hypothetical protein
MVRGVWLTREELAERLDRIAESYDQQVSEGESEKGAAN